MGSLRNANGLGYFDRGEPLVGLTGKVDTSGLAYFNRGEPFIWIEGVSVTPPTPPTPTPTPRLRLGAGFPPSIYDIEMENEALLAMLHARLP